MDADVHTAAAFSAASMPLLTVVAGAADGGGDAELRYTLLHKKSSTAVMLASGSMSTTLVA